jgi:fibronectin type 3 domain-containing protein
MKTLVLILALFPLTGLAQVDSSRVHLSLTARYHEDAVLLRWAPDKPGAWSLLNKTGYVLQRTEVSSDTSRMHWVNVHTGALLPQPIDKWKHFDTTHTYALVAAQALYGKTFAETFAEKADELSNRYSFTLLAADLDFETAEYAGLGYKDKDVEKGKAYAYRILAAKSLKNYLPTDTGTVGLRTVNEALWEGPSILKTEEGEGKVSLYWLKGKYTAYYIERSKDGKTFQKLNRKPFIPMDNPALNLQEQSSYADSNLVNYQKHWYRIVGIDAFGQHSAPGPAVTAMGRDRTPPPPATNLKTQVLKNGQVEITWQASPSKDLAGFAIGRSSENSLSGYEVLTQDLLPPNTRRFIDPSPYKNKPNYYIVLASDTAKNASASMASLFAFADTTAPAVPTGLKGSIDSLGILTLRWNPSPEEDLLGYYITFANDPTHRFVAAADSAIEENFFVDSLSLITLTKDIYFKVAAVDRNYNRSSASPPIKIKKPDKIPPAPAQFSDYLIDEKKVTLHFIPSSSDDAVEHHIYRRTEGQTQWTLVTRLPVKIKSYADTSVKEGQTYHYQLVTKDEAGLLSDPSALLRIHTQKNLKGSALINTKAVPYENGIKLSWSLPKGEIRNIVWYRAVNKGSFETLGTVSGTVNEWIDRSTEKDKSYEYSSKVYYKDGKSSPFSPTLTIKGKDGK